MKKTKRLAVIVSAVLMLSLTALNSAALTPALSKFETWNGTGSVSGEVNCQDSEFERLTLDGNDVDSADFTVEKQQDKVIITLKEEYLKSLDLKDGTYTFSSYFSRENYETDKQSETVDYEQNQLNFDLSPFEKSSDLASFKLTYGDSEIDPSHYTLGTGDSAGVVTFEEGFLETLPDGQSFNGHFVYNKYTYFSYMQLDVALEEAKETEPTEETEPYEEPQTAEETETVKGQEESPKTDSDVKTASLPFVLVATVSAACIILLCTYKKRREE